MLLQDAFVHPFSHPWHLAPGRSPVSTFFMLLQNGKDNYAVSCGMVKPMGLPSLLCHRMENTHKTPTFAVISRFLGTVVSCHVSAKDLSTGCLGVSDHAQLAQAASTSLPTAPRFDNRIEAAMPDEQAAGAPVWPPRAVRVEGPAAAVRTVRALGMVGARMSALDHFARRRKSRKAPKHFFFSAVIDVFALPFGPLRRPWPTGCCRGRGLRV